MEQCADHSPYFGVGMNLFQIVCTDTYSENELMLLVMITNIPDSDSSHGDDDDEDVDDDMGNGEHISNQYDLAINSHTLRYVVGESL